LSPGKRQDARPFTAGRNGVTYVGCLARWPTPKSGRGKRILHQPGVVTSDSGRFPTHAPGLRHAIQRLTGALAPGSAVDQLARLALTDVEDAWQRTQKVQAIHVALLASDREIANRGRWRRLNCRIVHIKSEIGFGLTRLLGFDLLPRIKRINKIRLYRLLTAGDTPLDAFLGGYRAGLPRCPRQSDQSRKAARSRAGLIAPGPAGMESKELSKRTSSSRLVGSSAACRGVNPASAGSSMSSQRFS